MCQFHKYKSGESYTRWVQKLCTFNKPKYSLYCLNLKVSTWIRQIDTINFYFTSLSIEFLTHKPAASFWKSTIIGQKQGIKSNEKTLQCKVSDYWYLWCVSLFLLIINPFNPKIKSTVIEISFFSFEISGSHLNFLFILCELNLKSCLSSHWKLSLLHYNVTFKIFWWIESVKHLYVLGLKYQTLFNSSFVKVIKVQILLKFLHLQLIFSNTLSLTDFRQFSKRGWLVSVNSLIHTGLKSVSIRLFYCWIQDKLLSLLYWSLFYGSLNVYTFFWLIQ